MASNVRTKRRKEPKTDIPADSNNMDGMPLQGELLLAIRDAMKEITQHRAKMSAQKNAEKGQHTEANPSSNQPEPSNKVSRQSMTDKLIKFKKFAPTPFKEAKTPEEVEEWLNELEGILETLKTEEEDKISFAEFLLQGEACEWWKMEKGISRA